MDGLRTYLQGCNREVLVQCGINLSPPGTGGQYYNANQEVTPPKVPLRGIPSKALPVINLFQTEQRPSTSSGTPDVLPTTQAMIVQENVVAQDFIPLPRVSGESQIGMTQETGVPSQNMMSQDLQNVSATNQNQQGTLSFAELCYAAGGNRALISRRIRMYFPWLEDYQST